MKKTSRTSRFVKPIMATLASSMSKVKACTSTIKLLLSLLRSKKLLVITGSVSRKLLNPAQGPGGGGDQEPSKEIVLYNPDREGGLFRFRNWWSGSGKPEDEDGDGDLDTDDDDKFQFPDATHPMFASPGFSVELTEEEEMIVNGGSEMQAVRISRNKSMGPEDEVDRAVDLFIRRYFLQQRMQSQP
ncbi:hypothetical protein SAY87_008590 [Trapa incisa]|uniref:Uncharacterized protein n=2 Tax=Trapa TaxID=22665 RepID=A0AAN7RJ11_TRANT|nr:hypothetical protein SAY87_008590 [Trapa incisa]KAK4798618.1 hypothetical protein SAY86_030944 [Trapa natans]